MFPVELRLKALEMLKVFHLFPGTRPLSVAAALQRFVTISHIKGNAPNPFTDRGCDLWSCKLKTDLHFNEIPRGLEGLAN